MIIKTIKILFMVTLYICFIQILLFWDFIDNDLYYILQHIPTMIILIMVYSNFTDKKNHKKIDKNKLRKAVKAKELYDEKKLNVDQICEILEIENRKMFFEFLKFENNRLGTKSSNRS